MKLLQVQIQPQRSPVLDVALALTRLQAVAPATVQSGDDDGPYINVHFRAADLRPVWAAVREVIRTDAALAACVIAVSPGERGWDDHLLLHHFAPSEPFDDLGEPPPDHTDGSGSDVSLTEHQAEG